MDEIIRHTLLKLLDSREINEVMRRIFVNATNTSYQANQWLACAFEDGRLYHDGWTEIGRAFSESVDVAYFLRCPYICCATSWRVIGQ